MPIKFGRFYYQQTSNGNLIGEYANQGMGGVGTESAIFVTRLVKPDEDEGQEKIIPFKGVFKATWLESTKATLAKLVIDYDPATRFYTLIWSDTKSNSPLFEGEGMLCGEILIGAYK